MRPQTLLAVGLSGLLRATVCEGPTSSADRARTAQFDFMNGPADLPNVFRGDSVFLFVWADVATDLVVVVNAPTGGVHALRRCGGTLTSTDNDRHVTGSGANAFGFRAQGIVDLASGGSARVIAESERLIAPDGTLTEILVNNVILIPR